MLKLQKGIPKARYDDVIKKKEKHNFDEAV